ncbi:putative SEC14 cytosolic factor [Triangularia verruculosa]|uniref:SEC14 cytosolic factor n=1 Tax=Triangularia verruculosa TaxID=2587418 RepID=A0AAN6XGZ2_9PEZI|nr:putative SEC14 cytosolic factor [Triangularia verruculosa]
MAGSPVEQVPSATGGGDEFGYPHGHLGHLTAEQENALQDFKAVLEERGLYKHASGEDASHEDWTLLRFLRARKWVVEDAYKQFKDTEDWRKANQLEALYDTIDVEAYEETRSLYPQWTGRRDRRGIPIYLFQIRHLDSKTVANYEKKAETTSASLAKTDGSTPEKLLRLFALYENLTRFAQPLCSAMKDRDNAETPITLSTNIVDVSQVSLRMFWNLKSHMQAASTLATAHYPETLDRIFIIGAPYFFSTVWGWIKRWFDPITVSKIFILSAAEVKTELERFIEPRNIPKAYGGELEFEFFDRPNVDPRIKEAITWEKGHTDFPRGPAYWVPSEDGKMLELFGVGRQDGKERREKICSIPSPFPKVEKPAVVAVKETEVNGEVKVDAAIEGVKALSVSSSDGKPSTTEISEKVAAAVVPDAATEEQKPAVVNA